MKMPLVSIAVVTYNSSKTVIETLDSIRDQTYLNIELIISDDCSKDDTVEVCRKWVEQNKDRFVRADVFNVEKNTGVSANFNRADAASRGEWVKLIAGDDMLMPNCVEEFVKYVDQHPDTTYVFSKVEVFGGAEERRKRMVAFGDYDFFKLTAEQQYDRLTIQGNCIYAATCFYNRKKARELGICNDERIPFEEDWPKWISITQKGIKLEFVDKVLVKYRMSEGALSTSSTSSVKFMKSDYLTYKYYCFKNDFKKGNKKLAIWRILQGERLLRDNNLFWKIICKIYKILIIHKW